MPNEIIVSTIFPVFSRQLSEAEKDLVTCTCRFVRITVRFASRSSSVYLRRFRGIFLESRCLLCDRRPRNRASYEIVPIVFGKSTRHDSPLVSDRHCHLRPDSRANASVVSDISPL